MEKVFANVVKKHIIRHNRRDNSDIHGHIKDMYKETLGINVFNSIPRVHEIICIQDKRYEVVNVIHVACLNLHPMLPEPDVILEVEDFIPCSIHRHCNDSWCEDIPLVIDLPEKSTKEDDNNS